MKKSFASFVLFAMALQAAVPVGFMPASVSDGWFLKWCPEGMSMAQMHALFGHHHHHHHHHPETAYAAQCDLAALTADAMLPEHADLAEWAGEFERPVPPADRRASRPTSLVYLPRAPPHLIG